MDRCTDKLTPIKRQCLKLTNCSFKKAQSGSENPATLHLRPSSCFCVTSGRFFFNGTSVRRPWTRRDKLFISLEWGFFFLLFISVFNRGEVVEHPAFFFFYRCIKMLLGNISRLGRYRNSCFICGMQPGIQAAHQKPSIINHICLGLIISGHELHPSTHHRLILSLSTSCSSIPSNHSRHASVLFQSLLDSLFILESFIQKNHTHIHTHKCK